MRFTLFSTSYGSKEKGYKGNDNNEASEWLSAVAKGLDMSKDARILRAKSMGFITDIQSVIEVGNGQNRGRITEAGLVIGRGGQSRAISGEGTQRGNLRGLGRNSRNDPQTFYHGTADDISKFELSHPNRKDFGWLGDGVYVTNEPIMADHYANTKAGNANSNVMPLYIRPTNLYQATLEDKKRLKHVNKAGILKFTEMVKNDGYDGVELTHFDGTQEICIFNPDQVRSIHAAFDPDNQGSSNILASKAEATTNDNIKFSRSTPANTPASKSMAGLADQARQFIANHTDSAKTFNWWHNTIGTQAHKATVDGHFKKVFEASMAMERPYGGLICAEYSRRVDSR